MTELIELLKKDELQEFVNMFQYGAYLKDPNTREYIASNAVNAGYFGLIPSELAGKKFGDFKGVLTCSDDYFSLVENKEKESIVKNGNTVFYTSEGFVDPKGIKHKTRVQKK